MITGAQEDYCPHCGRPYTDLEATEPHPTGRRQLPGSEETTTMSTTTLNHVHPRTSPGFDVTEIFNHPDWRPLKKEERMSRDLYPNVIYQNRKDRKIVIVLRQSETDGLSLGTTVVEYYLNRIEEGVVERVIVTAWSKSNIFIDWIDLSVLAKRLRRYEPNRSNTPGWPSYWWLKEDFTVSSKEDFKGSSDML